MNILNIIQSVSIILVCITWTVVGAFSACTFIHYMRFMKDLMKTDYDIDIQQNEEIESK